MTNNIESIAKILSISPNDKGIYPFKISSDVYKDLYLIHYNQNYVSSLPYDSPINQLRGTIVSLNQQKIVCSSFGYIPSIIAESSDFLLNKTLIDTNGINYDITKYDFYASYDGAMIRVWMYEDELMISTHRQINASKATWGSDENLRTKFLNYFNDTDKLKEMVNGGKVAYFILIDQDLLMASKFSLQNRKGLVIFSEIRNEDGTKCEDKCYLDLPSVEFCNDKEYENLNVFGLHSIKVNDINHILQKGFYNFTEKPQNDPLCLGESITLAYELNGMRRLIHIKSPAYARRFELVGNQPFIIKRAFDILKLSQYGKTDVDLYIDNFPPIPNLTEDYIDMMTSPIIEGPLPENAIVYTEKQLTDRKDYLSYDRRFDNAMMWYAFSLPPKYQITALRCISRVKMIREKVITHVIKNKNEFTFINSNNPYLKYVSIGVQYSKNKYKGIEKKSEKESLINKSIRKSILKATGDYLFEMAIMFVPNLLK